MIMMLYFHDEMASEFVQNYKLKGFSVFLNYHFVVIRPIEGLGQGHFIFEID